ncbi:hypothetical protein HJFPF1_12005 [Paramyrothecium foliicola]|nr:hypothetical protein HJFPF1_12005 [Paramyrothecium foliicola]
MLPGFLKHSYKQYKEDTARLGAWLVVVAKKCGHEPITLPDETSSKSNANDNDKARTRSSGAGLVQPTTYRVGTRELLRLARLVAASSTTAPISILAVTRRAIALRKNVMSWFLKRGKFGSNKKHAHFIEVLEEICEVLEWQKPKTSTRATDNDTPPKPTTSLNNTNDKQPWLNQFATLTMEETEDVPLPVPDQAEVIEVATVEDDSDEDDDMYLSHGFFRILCLFHDLQQWRAFISETWNEYAALQIDLMSASVVTDAALEFARDLIQDTVDDVAAWFHEDDFDLQNFVYGTVCESSEEDLSPSLELGLPFNTSMGDIAEWCFLWTGILLESYVPIIKPDSLPVFKPGYFGWYDPKADRERMSTAEKFTEDKILLLELLPEFSLVEMTDLPLPVRDKITTGFVDFIRSKKPTLWLSFAAQVLLDAHHTMRHSCLSAFDDLRMASLRIVRIIDDFWKLSGTHSKPEFWSLQGDEELKRIRRCIETFVQLDPLELAKTTAAEYSSSSFKHDREKHLLFSRNPVLCGLFMFQLNLRMQTIGQGLVNQWYDVQQLAFLHNLVEKQTTQKLAWPDMDMFLKIHGEKRIFIGDRPRDAAQSLNRLEIVTGISSVTRFASNSRRRNPEWHRPDGRNGRSLEPTTKVMNIFRAQYLEARPENANHRSIHSADIDKFLTEFSEDRITANDVGKAKGAKRGERQSAQSTPQSLLKRTWLQKHDIGAIQLLSLLKSKLFEEEPVLMFDYFAMHRRSMEILRLIQAKEHHKLVQYFTADYMPKDIWISNLVILLHHVARGSVQSGQALGLQRGGVQVVSRIIVSSGEVMKTYLARNGDSACRDLRTFCKNKAFASMDDTTDSASDKVDERLRYAFSLEQILGPAEMESLKTGILVVYT